jgi:hypothetical protein
LSATVYRVFTLHCDGPQCRRRYQSGRGPVPRAEVRRSAADDGWTHVHEDGMQRSQDTDYCPEHKPAEGEASRG